MEGEEFMGINWEKRYLEYRDLSNPYIFEVREDCMGECCTGLISLPSKDQNLSFLGKYIVDGNEFCEYIIGTICISKLTISFTINYLDGKYKLTSTSPISLRTYEELSLRVEKWGEFESIERCMVKAMSVIKGFQVYFLTGKENNGDYLKY